MRQYMGTAHNRALVMASSLLMFFCAVLSGVARQVFERFEPDFKTAIVPGPPFEYATLGVIALLLLTGMGANALLVMYPMERRRGTVAVVVMGVVLLVLIVIAWTFGWQLLRLFSWHGHSVGGGGEE
jgi:hypothetical protein